MDGWMDWQANWFMDGSSVLTSFLLFDVLAYSSIQVLEQLRPRSPLSKLSGSAGVLELISDFVGGVRRGRELRNAREFAECLVAMGTRNDGAVAAVAAAE